MSGYVELMDSVMFGKRGIRHPNFGRTIIRKKKQHPPIVSTEDSWEGLGRVDFIKIIL